MSGAVVRLDEAIRALAGITDPAEIREHEIKAETMAQYFARTLTKPSDASSWTCAFGAPVAKPKS